MGGDGLGAVRRAGLGALPPQRRHQFASAFSSPLRFSRGHRAALSRLREHARLPRAPARRRRRGNAAKCAFCRRATLPPFLGGAVMVRLGLPAANRSAPVSLALFLLARPHRTGPRFRCRAELALRALRPARSRAGHGEPGVCSASRAAPRCSATSGALTDSGAIPPRCTAISAARPRSQLPRHAASWSGCP
jgi:hypothetical protein